MIACIWLALIAALVGGGIAVVIILNDFIDDLSGRFDL